MSFFFKFENITIKTRNRGECCGSKTRDVYFSNRDKNENKNNSCLFARKWTWVFRL